MTEQVRDEKGRIHWSYDFDDKIIEVCEECERASCAQGIFLCDNSREADVKLITVRELREKHQEPEGYWRSKTLCETYGTDAPWGYTTGEKPKESLHGVKERIGRSTSLNLIHDDCLADSCADCLRVIFEEGSLTDRAMVEGFIRGKAIVLMIKQSEDVKG